MNKDVYTHIRWANGNGEVEFVMMQDVREILRQCKELRESGIKAHSELGPRVCKLPLAVVRHAEENDIDLSDFKVLQGYLKFMKDRYNWDFSTTPIDTGNRGNIIIR